MYKIIIVLNNINTFYGLYSNKYIYLILEYEKKQHIENILLYLFINV